MGIDISKFSNNNDTATNNNNQKVDVPEVQQDNFDIVEYTDSKKNELRQSKEVEQLTSLIQYFNLVRELLKGFQEFQIVYFQI